MDFGFTPSGEAGFTESSSGKKEKKKKKKSKERSDYDFDQREGHGDFATHSTGDIYGAGVGDYDDAHLPRTSSSSSLRRVSFSEEPPQFEDFSAKRGIGSPLSLSGPGGLGGLGSLGGYGGDSSWEDSHRPQSQALGRPAAAALDEAFDRASDWQSQVRRGEALGRGLHMDAAATAGRDCFESGWGNDHGPHRLERRFSFSLSDMPPGAISAMGSSPHRSGTEP
ncbi:unnamed protein product, partial [Polarella glacialis]